MTDLQKAKLDFPAERIRLEQSEKRGRSAAQAKIVGSLRPAAFLFAMVIYFYNSIALYLGAGRDDTFIVLWTGMAFAEGHGLVNYNLEPTEMSSSILHTVMVAVLYMVAPDFIYTLNKLLGLMAGAVLLVVLYQKRQELFGDTASGAIIFAISILALANSRAWLYWNMGGLETPFQTLILFLYGLSLIEFMKTSQKVLPLVILQILYILVRPEGFMLILFTGLCVFCRGLFHQPLPRKHVLLVIGAPGVLFLCILIARYLHFGLLFPNPVYAKVQLGTDTQTLSNLETGIQYLKGFYTSSPYIALQLVVLIVLMIQYMRILIHRNARMTPDISTTYLHFAPLLGLILLNHLFVIGVGGDWMEFYRFLVPVIPFMVILTTLFALQMLRTALTKLDLPESSLMIFTNLALGVLFLAAIATNSNQQDNHEIQGFHNCSETMDLSKLLFISKSYPHLDDQLMLTNCASNRDWLGVLPFIQDELPRLYNALDQKVILATFQMGFFPYFIKEVHPTMNIEFIDTVGLADSNIARMNLPKANFGLRDGINIVSIFSGQSGELSQYVTDRNPNMIYVLDATDMRRKALARLGWSTVWDKPGAVVFIKVQE
jgi:hypothetical protein